MKNDSKFLSVLSVLPSFGAASNMLHKKESSWLSARWFAGSDLLPAELCSDQRSSTLRADVNYDHLMEKIILISSLTILH